MVDTTLLVALSDLETQQTKETQLTIKNLNQLLNYCCGFPNETIRYTKSDMILKVHSDSGYLNVVGSKSRVGCYFYMGNEPCVFVNSRLALTLRILLENLGYSQPPTPIFTDNMT